MFGQSLSYGRFHRAIQSDPPRSRRGQTHRALIHGTLIHRYATHRRLLAAFALLGSVALLGACSNQPTAPRVEEAFVARKGVGLRSELKREAPVVATLDLGERVEIIARRRRFVKVRTSSGVVGWTRDTRLATPALRQMMAQLRDQTRAEPPQGTLRALYTLNVHLEPYRWSPTIYQLREDEDAELLRHRLVDRLPHARQEGKPPPAPTGLDDWYLVRTTNGQAGWVLTTGMYSAIPDEVKQYAERRRITSYFALDEVEDPRLEEPKKTWLWTQITRSKQPHEFDQIRVFMWSRRRQSYETIKLERGLTGYLPVRIHEKVEAQRGTGPGFTIVVEKKGKRLERTYVLLKYRVYRVDEKPARPPPPPIRLVTIEPPLEPPRGLMDRLWALWRKSS